MSNLQWFEYDKTEEMLEALERNIAELEKDIAEYGENLSRTSLIAMKNEVGRLGFHVEDVKEILETGIYPETPTISEESS